jgi:hypothetical protein
VPPWLAPVPTAQPLAAPPSPPLAQQTPPAPLFRGQIPDEPTRRHRPARIQPVLAQLSMPSPEQLGVSVPGAATPSGGDWTALHRRLDLLGVHATDLEKYGDGYRFVCVVPTGQPDHFRRFEAQAALDTEAARLALDAAEKWAGGK